IDRCSNDVIGSQFLTFLLAPDFEQPLRQALRKGKYCKRLKEHIGFADQKFPEEDCSSLLWISPMRFVDSRADRSLYNWVVRKRLPPPASCNQGEKVTEEDGPNQHILACLEVEKK
ncbi:1341_t:CDS:2, partial [Acaulospora colombiana]